jgi:L,D-peptidoglycan transpeptidase YkuD (ErfK/YbiS/YcfS/YnhG family)
MHADGFHKTPAEWQAKYTNMPNPPGTMGFSRASGMSGWIPKPEDRWYKIYSKEYNEYYYHNFCDKKSEWTEPKYWLDY